MKKLFAKISYTIVAVFMSATLLTPTFAPVAYAEACSNGTSTVIPALPTWWRGLGCEDGKPTISSPKDVWKIALNVIEAVMVVAGYVAVGYVIWGGFKYLTSDGDEGKIKAGRQIITNALIGLTIVFASVAMVNFVAGIL